MDDDDDDDDCVYADGNHLAFGKDDEQDTQGRDNQEYEANIGQ